MAQGHFDEALASALAVDPLDRMAGRGGRTAFLAAVVAEDRNGIGAAAERITAADDLPAAERALYRAWHERVAPGEQPVSVLVPADPAAAATVFANLEALAKLEATDAFEQLYPLGR